LSTPKGEQIACNLFLYDSAAYVFCPCITLQQEQKALNCNKCRDSDTAISTDESCMFGSLYSIAIGLSDKHGIKRIQYPTRQVFTSYKQGNKVVQYAKLYIYRSFINPYLISPIFAIPLTLYPVTDFSFYLCHFYNSLGPIADISIVMSLPAMSLELRCCMSRKSGTGERWMGAPEV